MIQYPKYGSQTRMGDGGTDIGQRQMRGCQSNAQALCCQHHHRMTAGNPGDIFVQKSPAATIEVLAKALLELYKVKNQIKIIGTRHGEKLYETLINRKEIVKAEDLGNFYRIPADTRDLNYNRFFIEGEAKI